MMFQIYQMLVSILFLAIKVVPKRSLIMQKEYQNLIRREKMVLIDQDQDITNSPLNLDNMMEMYIKIIKH
jgi:hypothetical protein